MRLGMMNSISGLWVDTIKAIRNLSIASTADSTQERTRQNIVILAIVLLGLTIRLFFFSGDGLGDDPNYFASFKQIYDGFIFNTQYHHRFSYWMPQIMIWKLFGINEFTFILPVLLSSLGCIYVVFLITRELFGPDTAFIAAALMAVNPFEVLNATLISTDVNLSLYMLLSVYFFIRAQQTSSARQFFLSALFVMFAFVNKPFGLFVLPMLGIFYLRREGLRIAPVLKYRSFIVSLAVVFLVLFGICWKWTGDPLIILNIYKEGKEPFNLFKMNLDQMLIYPKQMFFKHENSDRLHGYHFVTVLLAILLIRKRNIKDALPVLAWFLTAFALLNFVPHKIIDSTPYTAQRIFRYFVFVVPPSVIFVSYFWGRLKIYNKTVFAALFISYAILSVYWSHLATKASRIAFGETRSAIKYLASLGDVDIHADPQFISKIVRHEKGGEFNNLKLHSWYNTETPEGFKNRFMSVQEGYVVTGGPRLPYIGCYPCIPNLGDFRVPNNWKLVKVFNGDLYPPWKVEPLRIWHVTKRLNSPALEATQVPMDAKRTAVGMKPDSGKPARNKPAAKPMTDEESFKVYKTGMEYYDKDDCAGARKHFDEIAVRGPDTQLADDALYFDTICYFRSRNWTITIDHFKRLVEKYPGSNWIAGAHYHMGYSYKQLGDYQRARQEFEYVIEHFPNDKPLAGSSRANLKELPGAPNGGFFRKLFNW